MTYIDEAPINILLAEDSYGDVRLTKEVFKDSKMKNNLFIVNDGIEVLEFLRKENKFKGVPRPDLILLDLNMPRMDGRETLTEIKNDPDLKKIPTIILTTSSAETDILTSYELHANCYITKPFDFDQFIEVGKKIEEFWFSVVKLPTRVTE